MPRLSPLCSEDLRKLYGDGLRFCRYHADLFPEQQLSYWENHQKELEIARTARIAA
jgi:hypothetical protein